MGFVVCMCFHLELYEFYCFVVINLFTFFCSISVVHFEMDYLYLKSVINVPI